jgi:hypothetical protein
MWNGDDFVIVDPSHVLGRNQCVDNRFLSRLNRSFKQRSHPVVREHGQLHQP